MKEIDYLNRFEEDLQKILTRQSREDPARQTVYSKIHSQVKLACEREISRVKSENYDLAAYLENFSNGLLVMISDVQRSEFIETVRISAREDLLNDILESVRKEADNLQAIEDRDGQAERESRDLRSIGERPVGMKEKRSLSKESSDDAELD